MDIKGHHFILNCKLLFPCISLDERATFQKFTHRLLHCAKVEHENNPHGKTCINLAAHDGVFYRVRLDQ